MQPALQADPLDADAGWTTERVQMLKNLWKDGLSASQIAGELGGVTRNAIIGKVHRLGLDGRVKVSPITTYRRGKRRAEPTPRPAVQTSEAAPQPPAAPEPDQPDVAASVPFDDTPVEAPGTTRVTLLQLTEKTCRWPLGHPRSPDFAFCGAPSDNAVHPYCNSHRMLSYNRDVPTRRDFLRPRYR